MIVGLGTGIGVGMIVLVITFFLTFTICPDTSTAERVFPFALIADPSLIERPLVALLAALIQFPVYGMVLGFIWAKADRTRILFVISIFVLSIGHLVAGSVASHRVEKMWHQKFAEAGY